MRNLSNSCKFCPENNQTIRLCMLSCEIPLQILLQTENERKITEDKEHEKHYD